MDGFFTIVKMNLKLLLRNKGYLAFLIILPIISVLMLNIKNNSSSDGEKNTYVINELNKENSLIFNTENTKLTVKVYDCSNSKLSNYIIQELAKTGSYYIYRYKGKAIKLKEAREKALYSANHSVIGAVIYFPDTFDTAILNGKGSNMRVFEATKDGRIKLLMNNLNAYLQSINQFAAETGYDKTALNALLKASVKNEVNKKIVNIEVGDALNLTTKQKAESTSIGYSLSFLTIAFLFCGVFIAATVVEERHNMVYNRFLLSQDSLIGYGLVKCIMILMTAFIEMVVIAAGIKLFVKTDFGIPFWSYLFFVFCLGLIFNLLSVVIGVLTNNVMTSNYIAFMVWNLTCLLAGLYFPLDGASKWWARASLLMPQRWVRNAAEMLMSGKSGVYSMFLLVVLAYLLIIMSTGLIGIKMSHKE